MRKLGLYGTGLLIVASLLILIPKSHGQGTNQVELNPARLFFLVPPGHSASQSTTLTNVGSATLSISGITVQGYGAFHLTNNTCGSGVAAGKSCTITVTANSFPPMLVASATLYVYDNGGGSPQHVSLLGLGCSNIQCRPVN